MAIVPDLENVVTTTDSNGNQVVTDFKLITTNWTSSLPTYKSSGELMCPYCGVEFFRFIGSDSLCINCNEKMVHVIELDLENDDIIESRFEILDL